MTDPLKYQHVHTPTDPTETRAERNAAALNAYLARVEADGYHPLGPPIILPGQGPAEGALVVTGNVKRVSPLDAAVNDVLTGLTATTEPKRTLTALAAVQDGDMVQVVMNAQNARWLERILRVRRLNLFPIPVTDDLPTFGIGMRDDDND